MAFLSARLFAPCLDLLLPLSYYFAAMKRWPRSRIRLSCSRRTRTFVKEQADHSPAMEDTPLDLPGAGWSDWRWLALLLVLVACLRTWQLTHTEVASRDCIGYIREA